MIIGDSNVERNILHTGRLYCEEAESVPARNLHEFHSALHLIQPNKHKLVVFAMMTNLVISAGSTISSANLPSRLAAINTFLKDLIREIT